MDRVGSLDGPPVTRHSVLFAEAAGVFIERAMLSRIPSSCLRVALTVLSVLWLPSAALAVSVSGAMDRDRVRAGDTVTVHVVGKRVTGDPGFLGAAVEVPSDWNRGGQSVISPRSVADTTIKEWRLQFVPTQPGSVQVIPIVIVGQTIAATAAVDSVRGAPVLVTVDPVRTTPIWPWFLAGAVVIVATLGLIIRTFRRRRETTYERSDDPPLAEALRMLDSVRTNRREDRGRQYLVDIERVVHGYISRRLGIRLTGMTATEIGLAVAPHCSDAAVVEELTALLKRCGETKFGGAHISYDTLSGIEGQARSVLERLDANWV